MGTNAIACVACGTCGAGFWRETCGDHDKGTCSECASGKYKTNHHEWNTKWVECNAGR
jgi:hypothetical protein